MLFKHKRILFFFILLIVLFWGNNVLAAVDCSDIITTGVPQTDCEAVMALYNSTNGSAWSATVLNWNTPSSLNTWTGITINNGRVTRIQLGNKNLNGTIPSEIGNLSSLAVLDLFSNPQLSGTLPTTIENLTNLTQLNLYGCNLSGSLPNMSSLTKIGNIYLYNNHFTGSIPAGISATANNILLYNNHLSGRLPDDLKTTPPLNNLRIENNNFIFSDFVTDFTPSSSWAVTFTYSPQAKIDATTTIDYAVGETLIVTPGFSEDQNDSYQWYKDGNIIVGANSRIYIKENAQLEDGGIYTYTVTNSIVTGLTLTSYPFIVNVNTQEKSNESVHYLIDGKNIWVRSKISNTKDVVSKYIFQDFNNAEIDFHNTYIVSSTTPDTVADYSAGIPIDSGAGDDTCPIYNQAGYLSAGHGLVVPVVVKAGHGKDASDIGSIWQNGSRNFTLVDISGNNLTFYPEPYISIIILGIWQPENR